MRKEVCCLFLIFLCLDGAFAQSVEAQNLGKAAITANGSSAAEDAEHTAGIRQAIRAAASGLSLINMRQFSDSVDVPFFATLPPGDGYSNYDRYSFGFMRALRAQMIFMFIVATLVPSAQLAVVDDAVSEIYRRTIASVRLCNSVHLQSTKHSHPPKNAEDCDKKYPKYICKESADLFWQAEDWTMCFHHPNELVVRQSELQAYINESKAVTLLASIFTYYVSVMIESLQDTNSAITTLATKCTDRDQRLIRKVRVGFYFRFYMSSPRCPDKDGVQTGFAEFTDDMKWVKYTCFPGHKLVGPDTRQVINVDGATDSLEDEMPECVPDAGAVHSTNPTNFRDFIPEGTAQHSVTKGGPLLLIFDVVLLVYMYVSNVWSQRKKNIADMKKYEEDREILDYSADDSDEERALKAKHRHEAKNGPAFPTAGWFYFAGGPLTQGGTATRLGLFDRLLTRSQSRYLILAFGLQLISFGLFLMVLAFTIEMVVAIRENDVSKVEAATSRIP